MAVVAPKSLNPNNLSWRTVLPFRIADFLSRGFNRALSINSHSAKPNSQAERLLVVAVPLLAGIFLLLVAGTRLSYLLDERVETLNHAASALSLTARVVTPTNPRTKRALAAVVPERVGDARLSAVVLDRTGRVYASSGTLEAPNGVSLVRLTSATATASTAPQTGSMIFDWDNGQQAISVLRPMEGGLLLLAVPTKPLLASWLSGLQVEAMLFALLAAMLATFVIIYCRENQRGRELEVAGMQASAQFDTALLRGHCGLWDWDIGRGQISWSLSMYELLGLPVDKTVLGFSEVEALLHPSDADFLGALNAALARPGGQFDHRFRMRQVNGGWVWLRMRAECVTDKSGLQHLVGIAFDISEQEALKQQSRDAGLRLAEAIESISEAFVLWDARKRLVMCNSKYRQLYNLTEFEARPGVYYEDLTTSGCEPSMMQPLDMNMAASGAVRTFEAEIGNGRWLQISQRRTQDGGFVSIGTDVTPFKRAQARAADTERRHEKTIETLKLSQNQLELQAQKLVELAQEQAEQRTRAEAGNKAKSEFLANISHELRTPLNAIIGFSDIMRTKTFGPLGSDKYDEYAGDIYDSGNFLLGVINDVLDMSKIEAGRFQINPEEVHLDTVIGETMRIISMQAEKEGIDVEVDVPDDLNIQADRRAVKQILINLLSNAVKFTPEGGRVAVTVKPLSKSVAIVIQDSGIGITPEALSRLGQPFEQVQDQFTKDHKGSGLGLAIARSLAHFHGGSLKIRSKAGKGTMVAVRLPNEAKQNTAPASEAEAEQLRDAA
jgi:two-component system cell cycle sensor histidine kinase PleC